MGKGLPGKIPPGKNSATIIKSDGINSATLFHGEGQGLRSALLTEGDTTWGKGVMRVKFAQVHTVPRTASGIQITGRGTGAGLGLEKDVQQNVDVFIQVLGCSCLCRTATYREHSVS